MRPPSAAETFSSEEVGERYAHFALLQDVSTCIAGRDGATWAGAMETSPHCRDRGVKFVLGPSQRSLQPSFLLAPEEARCRAMMKNLRSLALKLLQWSSRSHEHQPSTLYSSAAVHRDPQSVRRSVSVQFQNDAKPPLTTYEAIRRCPRAQSQKTVAIASCPLMSFSNETLVSRT